MQNTSNYNLNLVEGTDIVNPPIQFNPNFQTIDAAMFANKEASIGTASEVVTGTVHAIVRANQDAAAFRFTATGAWTTGDTMTVDGTAVTVHLNDGTAPLTGAYVIGAEVFAVLNGTLVTLITSSAAIDPGVTSFNSRTGAVTPASSDYDASMIDYDNTGSGLTSTDVQGAIDEIAGGSSQHGLYEIWKNNAPTQQISQGDIASVTTDKSFDMFFVEFESDTSHTGFMEIGSCENGSQADLRYMIVTSGGILTQYRRFVSISQVGTTITIRSDDGGTTQALNSYGSAPTTTASNNVCIPIRILGVIHNN